MSAKRTSLRFGMLKVDEDATGVHVLTDWLFLNECSEPTDVFDGELLISWERFLTWTRDKI